MGVFNSRLAAGLPMAILAAGALLTWQMVGSAKRELCASQLEQGRFVAHAINLDDLKTLTGTAADTNSPVYLRLKEQLATVRSATPHCRFVYLLGKRPDDTLFFFADSEPADSKDYSPPGQVYVEAPKGFHSVFGTRNATTEGPYTDRWGKWISTLVPIIDPQTVVEGVDDLIIGTGAYRGDGQVLAMLKTDFDANAWNWELAQAALPPALLTLMLEAIALIGSTLLAKRSQIQVPTWWQRHLEPALVAATGLALSLFAGWVAHQRDIHNRNEAFTKLAATHSEVIAETLRNIRNIELEGLSHTHEHSATMSAKEFKLLTSHLTGESAVQAWQWVPAVMAADKPRFEAAARADDLKGYEIWQKDAQGKRIPAKERAMYYPVLHVTPLVGNERALGYDFGSEPLPRSALDTATRTGLPTATDPITLAQGTGSQKGMVVFRPVFDPDDSKRLRGFASIVLRMGNVLRVAMPDNSVLMELTVLGKDGTSESLATSWQADRPQLTGTSQTRFVLSFDKVLRVTAWAGPEFIRQHPLWLGWLASLTGWLATTALVIGSAKNLRRREQLERLVLERTRELRASEQSYRNQFAHNSAVMLLVDPTDGAIIDANAAAVSFYGYYSREQLMAMHIADINPFQNAKLVQFMTSVVQSEHGQRFQFQHRLANGELRDVEVSSCRIQFGGRSVLHSIVFDVTERKRAEELSRQLTERLSLATRAGAVGIWDYDVINNKLVWDEEMFRLYGITRNEFGSAYESWMAGVHPDDRQRNDQEIQLALLGEKKFDTEFRALWPDGSTHYIRALAIVQRDASGQATHMVGTNWDITAQKRAELLLQEKTALLEAQTNASIDGVLVIDENNKRIFINQRFVKMFYVLQHIVENEDQSLLLKHVINLTLFPEQFLEKVQYLHNHRNEISHDEIELKIGMVLDRYSAPVWGVNGKYYGRMWTFRDITEQKLTEEKLIDMNSRLEQETVRAETANAAKSEFLANMSHEIRTPLNGVLGMVGLLLDTNLTGDQRHYAQSASASGEALLSLINDILDFSKIEAGKLELETLDFGLHSFLDDFAVMMALRAHQKGLVLGCVVAPEVPSALQGDPGRLRQILINLTGNAIKFTAQGEVVIRVSVISETLSDVRLRFAVQNSGIGIPENKIGRLFGKFSQVDASTTRAYGGTGLGLAISKQLTELMGGEIGINSEVGKGSEFWFTALLAKQPLREPAAAPELADLGGVRVLIVDNHPINREILTVLLKSWGMRPSEANDGPSALRALTRAQATWKPFTFAILDMQMPGMDGKSLGHFIKSHQTLKETRLVLHTSLDQMSNDQEVREIGFSATVTKPVRRQELLDVLTAVITGKEIVPSRMKSTSNASFGKRFSHVRILLAEDNITNQQVAVGILNKLGFRVDVAANGVEAVKALETLPYDLVLMDMKMPEMDGIEATRAIRDPQSRVLNHQVTIVAMTANAMQGDREKCVQAGMDDYLTKPIERPALVAVMEKWLKPKGEVDQPVVSEPEERVAISNSETNGENELAVFDRAAFMNRMVDDKDLALTILDGFLEDMPRQIAQLKNHLAAGDVRLVEQQAHKIKGACATVGGEALRAVAWAIEQAGKADDLDAARARVNDLDKRFEALKEALEK
jgi:PAS domain S-box-containing protein